MSASFIASENRSLAHTPPSSEPICAATIETQGNNVQMSTTEDSTTSDADGQMPISESESLSRMDTDGICPQTRCCSGDEAVTYSHADACADVVHPIAEVAADTAESGGGADNFLRDEYMHELTAEDEEYIIGGQVR